VKGTPNLWAIKVLLRKRKNKNVTDLEVVRMQTEVTVEANEAEAGMARQVGAVYGLFRVSLTTSPRSGATRATEEATLGAPAERRAKRESLFSSEASISVSSERSENKKRRRLGNPRARRRAGEMNRAQREGAAG
jgi:hypothetical protein